jgi:elongation factor G
VLCVCEPLIADAHLAILRGVVDLLTMHKIEWDDATGKQMTRTALSPTSDRELWKHANKARSQLIETLAEVDDEFVEQYLELSESAQEQLSSNALVFDTLQASDLLHVIRRATLRRAAVPILLGSSLKSKGVQPLLDAIVDFLPSPLDRALPVAVLPNGERVLVSPVRGTQPSADTVRDAKSLRVISPDLCALAFKVVHDHNRGLIVYARVYSGTLNAAQKLTNLNIGQEERAGRLFRIIANDLEPISELGPGDIAAIVGLKRTKTGDTLSLVPRGTVPIRDTIMMLTILTWHTICVCCVNFVCVCVCVCFSTCI